MNTSASLKTDDRPWITKGAAITHRAGLRQGHEPILNRLMTDPRMDRVWRELRQHRARVADGQPTLPEADIQVDALARTLHCAFHAVVDERVATTVREPQAVKQQFLDEAAILRRIADDLVASVEHARPYVPASEDLSQHLADAEALRRVAGWRDAQAAEIRSADDPLTITNARGDPLVRGVQITIAAFLKETFGSHLWRTAATLAAVALGLDKVPSPRVARSAFSGRKPA